MNKNNLIWIDLEMTGLIPEFHFIIEIATIITDSNLNILANGPCLAIYQSKKKLDLMDKWNINTHNASGLLKKVKTSKYTEEIAELETLNFLKKWVPKKKSPMCGNSVSQDRRFLYRYMPKLESYFHYRYIDVSSIKELAQRWSPKILLNFKKKRTHTASYDILESIKELDHYRQFFIKKNT